jgi:hypothetical protein
MPSRLSLRASALSKALSYTYKTAFAFEIEHMFNTEIAVVLVHGGWAECASWNEVLPVLQKIGLGAVCAVVEVIHEAVRCHFRGN